MKTGVLLINLGTPDSPSVADVRKYLREFLMDGRVIDIPAINRFFLVNGIIAPFRSIPSSKAYKKLWTEEGSPLKIYGYKVRDLLQQALGKNYQVSLAMRYQHPSIKKGLASLKEGYCDEIIVIPLYPQYASASTGSTIEAVMKEINSWEVIPSVKFISQFFQKDEFIQAFAAIGKKHLGQQPYDHILFSYHGLPQRQIRKASRNYYCQVNDACCGKYHSLNRYCYRAQCYETTRLLAKALDLKPQQYSVCFQSRLGKEPWITPYTDEVIRKLAERKGINILVFSPAFVADCLETTVEIAMEYKELFHQSGGGRLDLVESLNDHPLWVECLKGLVLESQSKPQEARH